MASRPALDQLVAVLREEDAEVALSQSDDLLRSLAEDTEEIGFSWHPLGFIQCRLVELEKGTLRLHIWPSLDRRPQSEDWLVHSHPFALTSLIVLGNLQQRIYKVQYVTQGTSGAMRLLEVTYTPPHSVLTPTGWVGEPVLTSVEEYGRGDIYRMAPGDYHDTFVPFETTAVTVALTEMVEGLRPMVVGRYPRQGATPFERKGCEPEYLKDLLARIVAQLVRR